MAQSAAIGVSGLASRDAATPAGLTSAEASRRRLEFGANTVAEKISPAWQRYIAKFWAPIPWMLEVAIILQIGLGKYVEAAVVAGLLLFNATLGFVQESRAGAVLAAMKKRLAPTALAVATANGNGFPRSSSYPAT